MTFFNKKEEVLDLELTPFGESLLSVGKFKPVYYAFFDDDILYDASGSLGVVETQNDMEPRIQANTPKSKTQALFSGVESNLSPFVRIIREIPGIAESEVLSPYGIEQLEGSYWTFPPQIDNDFTFVEPLGTMEMGSEYVPSWNIQVLDAELSAAINYMTSSAVSGIYNNVRRIPQLDFELNYRVLVGDTAVFDITGEIRDRIVGPIYQDGTFLYLDQERPELIVALDEDNASIDTEYDIEVFEVLAPISSKDPPELRPLYFQKKSEQVVDGILVDEPEIVPYAKLTPSYAEYYFQVNVDLEIPEEIICPRISHLEKRGIQVDDIPYNCPDVKDVGRFNLYRSNVTDDDIEVCDE